MAVITDHHIISVDRYFELKKLGQGKVNFLPGIELRTQLGGSKSVHLIGIFPEPDSEKKLSALWDDIKVNLNITEVAVEEKGDDNIYVSCEDAIRIIHKNKGLISIHAGEKSNSIEEIKNVFAYKCTQKKDIAQLVDMYEIGKLDDIERYEIKFLRILVDILQWLKAQIIII